MHLNEIRSLFLKFFESKGHKILPSSSLIPHNDPSLMFTNSGMVQFKNTFLGYEQPKYNRVTTSQKCVRAGGKHNDLDNVGYTARHHTFFEMLGNFSFGDYFKAEAIEFAWEFLTQTLKINKDQLYVTVYHTDDYAFSTWKKVAGLNDSRIIRIDTNDNFWSMGSTGPCGPCSEIFYDHGSKYEGGLPGSNNDGDRYIEIWNLVFMQNEQFENGSMNELPKPSIDTGIGLERLAAVMQGVNDNFSIDIFSQLISASKELSGNSFNITAHKVIADHLRAMSFLIADGVLPSNDGRGYVLRRIMRRAMRYVQNLGYKKPFLYQLVPTLVNVMGQAYSELIQSQAIIQSVIYSEEEKFGATLERGLRILQDEVPNIKNSTLAGEVAFKLYDTYGFPLDLTKDILRPQRLQVDEIGFESAMNEQKARARAAWTGSGDKSFEKVWFEIFDLFGSTEFFGYSCEEMSVKVLAIVVNGQMVESLKAGEEGIVVLNQTPFYGESGGQVGDSGVLKNDLNRNSILCTVDNTVIFANRVFGHKVICEQNLSVGMIVNAVVNSDRRNKIRANHSATHLLHKALRNLLGNTTTQKGSLVNETKLRFDFSCNVALSANQIVHLENSVNEMIRQNKPVSVKLMAYDDAVDNGAMALFGEKYASEVRVIFMCDSIELCGGTHVNATGDIGLFKIISESAISSGVRRIEAITGAAAIEYYNEKCAIVNELTTQLKCVENQILNKIETLTNEKKTLSKQYNDLLISQLSKNFELITHENGLVFAIQECDNIDINTGRSIVMNAKIENAVIFLAIRSESFQSIIVCTAKESSLNAKTICDTISEKFGGKGGGSNELSQIGGVPLQYSLHTIIKSII